MKASLSFVGKPRSLADEQERELVTMDVTDEVNGWWQKAVSLHLPLPQLDKSPLPLDDTTLDLAERQLRNDLRWEIAKDRLAIAWKHALDHPHRLIVGYGYRPARSLIWFAAVVVIGWVYFDATWKAGDMAPSAAVALEGEEWQKMARDTSVANPAEVWSAKSEQGQDYETFSAWGYAIDLFVPVVSLGQEAAWAPSTNRSPWGYWGFGLRWFIKAFRWFVTALGAAAITGIIRRD